VAAGELASFSSRRTETKMSDENIKQNEPLVQAADSKELTEKDLEGVTGGDKPTESLTLNFGKIEVKYESQ
jgi:hypothetical protein